MGSGGPIPGWQGEPGGPTADPARRSIPDRLAESWRIYRAHGRPLLLVALVVQGTLGLPLIAVSIGSVIRVLRLFSGDLAFPLPGTSGYLWTFGPFHDVILDYTVMGLAIGLIILGLVLTYGATSLLLLGGPDVAPGAVRLLRATFARGPGIVLAGLGVALGLAAVYWVQGVMVARQPVLAPPYAYDGTAVAAILFLSMLLLVGEFAAMYWMVRWIAAIPAIVLERRSLRAGLGRSSDLTRGRRRSVALLLLVAGFVVAIPLLAVDYIPTLVVGPRLGWDSPLVAVIIAVLALVGPVVTTPYLAVLLTTLYRDMRDAGPRPIVSPVDVPPGWGSNR